MTPAPAITAANDENVKAVRRAFRKSTAINGDKAAKTINKSATVM
jgi:hypothetical protein